MLYKNDFGFKKLTDVDFSWEHGKEYLVQLKAEGSCITMSVDGKVLLTAQDSDFAYGMYGCGSLTMGRTLFGDFKVEEL